MDENSAVYSGVFHNPLNNNYDSRLIGNIDEVRIWGRALTPIEIQKLMYTIADPGLHGDLIGYWQLNEGNGQVIFDNSVNLNNGDFAGPAWSSTTPFNEYLTGLNLHWSTSDTTGLICVSPTETTVYKLQVSNDNISVGDSVILYVNQLPDAYAGEDVEVCSGDSIKLTATGGENYSWDNNIINNISFIPGSSAIYIVQVTDSNNCMNYDTVEVLVKSRPARPHITLDSDTLVSTIQTGNQWYNDIGLIPGATDSIYVVAMDGCYYTIATHDGCSSEHQILYVLFSRENLKPGIPILPYTRILLMELFGLVSGILALT